MRNYCLKKLKKNDKGMTLVEVLVAMAILSIAGITFLQSFNYAMRNNVKAREKQHALVLAQSMMETAKAYSIDELDKNKDKDGNSIFSIYSRGTVVTPAVDGGVHTYSLEQVNYNGYEYDVVMTAQQSTGKNNAGDVASVHDPNKDIDAVCLQDIENEQNVVMQGVWDYLVAAGGEKMSKHLIASYGDASFIDKSLLNVTSRLVKLSITKDSGSYVVTQNATYNVSISAFSYLNEDGTTENCSGGSTIIDVPTVSVYSAAELKNVYFYFYPLYKRLSEAVTSSVESQWLMCDSDNVEIVNNADKKLNVYLVRQQLPAVVTTTVQSYETSYIVAVKLSGSQAIDLYHNAKRDLYTTSADKTVGYTTSGLTTDKVDKAKLYETNNKALVYDLTVKVCRTGETDPIITLNGSTNAR